MLLRCTWCGVICWDMSNLPVATSLSKKSDFLQQPSTPVAPQLGVGPQEPLPHLCWKFYLVDLVQVMLVTTVVMCATSVSYSKEHFTAGLPILRFTRSSVSSQMTASLHQSLPTTVRISSDHGWEQHKSMDINRYLERSPAMQPFKKIRSGSEGLWPHWLWGLTVYSSRNESPFTSAES